MTTSPTPQASTGPSPVSAAARAFVAAHLAPARLLGSQLADLVDDPEAFVAAVRVGFVGLADENYQREQTRIAPGLADSIGVRHPLLRAMSRSLERGSNWAGADSLLWLADRLLREDGLEICVVAFSLLERVLEDDPERGWQVMRGAARQAHEWITVDTLARSYGLGILLEPFRWAEIEQLAYSPSRWERRLVGSTIATVPFVDRQEGRRPEVAGRAIPIVANLIGDSEPDVQKALSWALRSLVRVDQAAVTAFAESESLRAAARGDGHRAWVIRDALPALPQDDAARIRERLSGIRKRPGSPSTSDAAAMADRFRTLVDETPAIAGPRSAAPIEHDRDTSSISTGVHA